MATKVYISGPMTGYENFNYPAFNQAEERLKAAGHEVENPAKNPDPDPKTWENFMRMALKQLCECDIVVVLPGWEKSRGAVIEVGLAETLGMKVYEIGEMV